MKEVTAQDELKSKIRRLNSEAGQLKMDLHDLAEDLPKGWENILDVAQRTFQKYTDLMRAKGELNDMEKKKDERDF